MITRSNLTYIYYLMVSLGQELGHDFTGVLCFRISHKAALKVLARMGGGSHLNTYLRKDLVLFTLLAALLFPGAVGLGASGLHWLSARGCPQFLTHGPLCFIQQEKVSASKMGVMVLCDLITEVTSCDI